MKRLIFTLIALAAMASAFSARMADATDKADEYTVYGVAFYNLENLFDTINSNGTYDLEFSPAGARQWDSHKYWSKINRLATAIEAMATEETPIGPAIVGVAEVENKGVMMDLVNAEPIKARGYKVVHHDSPDNRGIDVGLLYNPDLFKVINVTNHRLDVGFPTRDQMCVVGTLGGDTIAVIVNHWPSRLGGQVRSTKHREAAAKLCRQIADSLWTINPNTRVVIMGDLNDDPFDISCAEVIEGRKEPDGVGAHGFYNPWWNTLECGMGTLTYKGEWNLFDQIIMSGNLLGDNVAGEENLQFFFHKICDFDILKEQSGNYAGSPHRTFAGGKWLDGYSDHFPTEIFLIKQNR